MVHARVISFIAWVVATCLVLHGQGASAKVISRNSTRRVGQRKRNKEDTNSVQTPTTDTCEQVFHIEKFRTPSIPWPGLLFSLFFPQGLFCVGILDWNFDCTRLIAPVWALGPMAVT
jgi:hypothetical protein